MAVTVRPAQLTIDRDQIIGLQQRYLAADADVARFEWLYQKNPFGTARAWIAQDSITSEIIGTAAAFPRSLYVGSQRMMGWVLGDFCMHEHYRSLGPAMQLQRACLEGVGGGANAVWYDFPSTSMLAIYKRLKLEPSRQMSRFVKPLKVNRKVRSWVQSPLLQACLNGVGNEVLKWCHKTVNIPAGLTFVEYRDDCGEEFTELAETIGVEQGACLQRTASYLNWRYRVNPLYPCEFLVARAEGKLKGYAVFTETGSDSTLLDLFAVHDKFVILGLVDRVIDMMRTRGCEVLNVPIVEGHPLIPHFQSLGFQPRDASPVIVSGMPLQAKIDVNGRNETPFLLMQGDRDM